jgi:enediyne biosynthesis protein E3
MFSDGAFAALRRWCLDIPDREATVERRGFACHDSAKRAHLEAIGRTFLAGYRAAIADRRPEVLAPRLESAPEGLRGFAYEGAAMAVSLLDALLSWRPARFGGFVAGPAERHVYMAHVGAGWALARLPSFAGGRILRQLDPLYRWLAFDGYGFHQGYFAGAAGFDRQHAPPALKGYAGRAFDQGLGRALWFVAGAEADAIADHTASFQPARRADLWSGVGLAAAYAGGMERRELATLAERAAGFAAHLAQGAAFAAKARQRAGNPAAHTEEACRMLAGCAADAAAAATDTALAGLPRDEAGETYEIWRGRIRAALKPTGGADAPVHSLAEARGR